MALIPAPFTDEINCDTSKNVQLKEPDLVEIEYTPSKYNDYEISCHSAKDGYIDITPIGGDNTSYTYTWTSNNGAQLDKFAEDQDGLAAGVYNFSITDANGCNGNTDIELTQPPALYSDIEFSHVSCNQQNTGRIMVTPSGGMPSYKYQWSMPGAADTNTIENLVPDRAYFVTITDANDCQLVKDAFIIKTDSLQVATEVQKQYNGFELSCVGQADARVEVAVEKGLPPYTYYWSNGRITKAPYIEGVAEGTYSVRVEDTLKCDATIAFKIEPPKPLAIDIDPFQPSCNGYDDGEIALELSGGAQNNPYTVNWSNGDVGDRVTGLKAGFYPFTVTDANGCSSDSIAQITEPEPFVITGFNIVQPFCPEFDDGRLEVLFEGGTPGYQFLWSNGVTAQHNEYLKEDNFL
ncbi:MAG: hypothetical protein HC896_06175 [Bacteroidales bacterium]|nr:hypothetical protein [Bacteroidales bacterium]